MNEDEDTASALGINMIIPMELYVGIDISPLQPLDREGFGIVIKTVSKWCAQASVEHEVSHSAGAVESIGGYNLKINSRRNEAKQIENRDKKEHKKMRRHQRELEAEKKRLEAVKPKSSLSITRLLARQVSPKSVSTNPGTHEATGVASIQREEEDEPATGSGDHSRCLPWLPSRLAANFSSAASSRR
eukprot:FR744218.1.p1 GENE.FR744218.1~~FR744218.1.p1  ORF type:complete len:188 (+),score=10.56 FR744218.1:163-726(+)